MKPSIQFEKIWEDDDILELSILVSDGMSSFHCNTYNAHRSLKDEVDQLYTFKDQVYGGLYDLRFGEFGPEYASGAFHARLHFFQPLNGKLAISVNMETEWKDFTKTQVANHATIHLITEPALFDNWLRGLRSLASGKLSGAELECIL